VYNSDENENLLKGQDEVVYDESVDFINGHDDKLPSVLPVLPLKDMVVFPYTIFPILAGRQSSINAINKSLETDKYILLLAQIDEAIEEPSDENLYKTGVIAKIIQVLKMPNGLVKVLVDGIAPAKVNSLSHGTFRSADVTVQFTSVKEDTELKALVRRTTKLFKEYINSNKEFPQETYTAYENIKEPDRKLYYVASTLSMDIARKQKILELNDLHAQFYELLYSLSSELEILNVEKDIDDKVYQAMQKNQRKFIVQEQIRILQEELGEDVDTDPELIKLKERLESAGMPEAVKEKAMDEFNKLRKTPSMSPDFAVIRNYLEWMVDVPWSERTDDNFDLDHAKRILDEDHYDLEKPKERILELIAVLKLLKDKGIDKPPKGQILCLVGPPGVGKTSLGKSIARALNRKFTRISVGGVKDEAEIRGHRRTYIGSMPGKIIQAMKKAGTINPVILIDEIDKMSNDFRGDPSSAMLEVLDPEQNDSFNDHYLDVDYDLSNVLFVTTANVQYNIPLPLQDRMEIIQMRSYLDFEKVQIAKRHIIPKELSEHGLDEKDVKFTDKILFKIIEEYTREAGVRNLEREISAIIRKVTKDIVLNLKKGKVRKAEVTEDLLPEYLGVPKHKNKLAIQDEKGRVGSVFGLAWTSHGGDILHTDVNIMKGSGKLTLTGKLGDVMKESAMAGLSYIKANADKLKIPSNFFKQNDIHIHLPEGAIPKDGPSAGITMAMAMLSAITGIPAKTDVAMTGEITLRGDVLPIGGLNEKLLAALRSGIMNVLIPEDNLKDLPEVPKDIVDELNIIPMKNADDAIEKVFGKKTIGYKKKSIKSIK